MIINGVMLQSFDWDYPADGSFYNTLAEAVPRLAKMGVTAIWMPPAGKGTSDQDVGYGNYDYWDLGEFDQKGTVRTKYGTREELEACIKVMHENGIDVLADMVFNHKGGADESEVFMATMVDQNDRTKDVSEPHDIEGWTKFTFPGRKGMYSDFVWNFNHFTGIDFDQRTGTNAIYRIMGDGKYWSNSTDTEKGNFDYLMNADIDHKHPDVIRELTNVAYFMIDSIGYDGFRYDALKHIDAGFIDHLSNFILQYRPDFYFVGEYWNDDESRMNHYLYETDYNVDLFDVPLHFNFVEASKNPNYDIRQIFDGTLVAANDLAAVTFVDNHDSQPGQSLESWVEPWFKEIAYAFILLRSQGYPCLFAGDYYGIPTVDYPGIQDQLERLMFARMNFAYGDQDEYRETPTKWGWVRRGSEKHPYPLAVLVSTGDVDSQRMFVGEQEAGQVYVDYSGKNPEEITIDEEGFGVFNVGPGAVTYWARKDVEELAREITDELKYQNARKHKRQKLEEVAQKQEAEAEAVEAYEGDDGNAPATPPAGWENV
ncbi:MAG: alpha-amylase [Peptoniphilaceae bacterium]|nr:alpha-amylase [Peptoniphilaceae bacterium]